MVTAAEQVARLVADAADRDEAAKRTRSVDLAAARVLESEGYVGLARALRERHGGAR